jgi:hypothetical protein
MNPGVFLIQDNEELIEMNEQAYDSEKLLQSWLAKYPALLVGNQIDAKEPRRWLFIEQECPVPSEDGGSGRWAIDHLFLDQDAVPTIVEVKRSTDTRIRREVVGQMLDYAANATAHWPVSHMRERFADNCEKHGIDPEEKLRDFLGEDADLEEFWNRANRNLQDRKLRLLFVADVIPQELQRIVEFLNDQMDQTEVLAIEVKQFVSQQGLKSLVPRVLGQTAKAQQRKPGAARGIRKDEASFFETMAELATQAEIKIARDLLDWSKTVFTDINWGRSSFTPVFEYGADYTCNPLTVYTDGKFEIQFQRMAKKTKPFDEEGKRIELLRRLNNIPGINFPPSSINKYPRLSMAPLAENSSLEQFKNVIAWIVEEVSSTNTSKKIGG